MLTKRCAALAVVVCCLAAPPAVASAATSDDEPRTLAASVVGAAQESLGDDAPEAVARAYNAGFDVAQVLEGLLDDTIGADGLVRDDDGRVQAPVRPAATFVSGTAAGADPKLDAAIAKSGTRLAKQTRDDELGDAMTTTMVLLLLAGDGYSAEQILVDGLLGGGIRWSPDGVELRDERGKRVKPAGEDCCASVEDADERDATTDLIEGFVADTVELLAGIDPASVSAGDFDRDYSFVLTVEGRDDDGSTLDATAKGDFGRGDTPDWRGFLAGMGAGGMVTAGACSIGSEATTHPWSFSGDLDVGMSGRAVAAAPGRHPTANLRVVLLPSNLVKTSGDDSACVRLAGEISQDVADAVPLPTLTVTLKDGATAEERTTFGDATYTVTLRIA